MKSQYPLSLIGLLFVLWSCEKSERWDLVSLTEPVLIIEAILTNEEIVQEIRLSQSYAELNNEPPPVENAVVFVEANGVQYSFATDIATPGLYRSQQPFAVVDNLNYKLTVNWEGSTYEAESVLSAVAPMPTISFVPFNNTDSLKLANFVSPFDTDQQALYEIQVDWSHLTTVTPTQAKLFLYTFDEVNITQFILPRREAVGFPKGSIVQVTKYGLNDDFADYLRAVAIETDWNSSFFYGNPENPPTNISNGALGFFSTCAVIRETVVAE